jgi:hypothetical protein
MSRKWTSHHPHALYLLHTHLYFFKIIFDRELKIYETPQYALLSCLLFYAMLRSKTFLKNLFSSVLIPLVLEG